MSRTVATVLTGRTAAAIGVVLVAGPKARAIVAALTARVADLAAGQTRLARLQFRDEHLDDALVVCLDQERFELHLHGGVAVIDGVLAALKESGADIVKPEEAAAEGPIIDQEVLAALPGAMTETAVRLLAEQARGGLRAWAEAWRGALAGGARALTTFHSEAQWVLDRSRALGHLLEPPRVALLGAPNVGKSTLANALLGRAVSITSAVPGTTRDWVDATGVFAAGSRVAVAVTLVDTAGMRETQDAIEVESIARTHVQGHAADVVVLVLDATGERGLGLVRPFVEAGAPVVAAINKADVLGAVPPAATVLREQDLAVPAVYVSAKEHRGLETLQALVLEQLGLAEVSIAESFVFAPRQEALLAQAAETDTPAEAAALLASLLGESYHLAP